MKLFHVFDGHNSVHVKAEKFSDALSLGELSLQAIRGEENDWYEIEVTCKDVDLIPTYVKPQPPEEN